LRPISAIAGRERSSKSSVFLHVRNSESDVRAPTEGFFSSLLEIIRRSAQRIETADIESTCEFAPKNQREVLLDVAAGPDDGLAVRRAKLSRRFAL
jgi:hypothetical protein